MTNLLLLICLTFIRASESNSAGSIENDHDEKGQTLDRPIPPHQGQTEIASELEKSHSGKGSASSSIRNKKATNPLKNAEANPFTLHAIQQGKVPNPLLEIDSQKFNNDPVNVIEANPLSGIHRGKVPNPLFLDDRLTREVMDIYEGFVSHQPLIGDKKPTNPIINAKEANHLTETVTGSHLSGVVPQNSRNPLKRSDSSKWGEFLQDLEDGRKIQSKTVPPNSRKVEKAPKKRRYENAGQLAKTMSVEDEVMKNVLENYQDQDQFKYNWKNWDKKVSNHLSGVVPRNSRNPLKRAASKDWDHFLQMMEAEREAKHSTVVPPNVRKVLEGHTILRPVPNPRIINTSSGIFNIIL